MDKRTETFDKAVADVFDRATIMCSGFGYAGQPDGLCEALARHGAKEITIISNNAGYNEAGLGKLFKNKQVKKLICSFPAYKEGYIFREQHEQGLVELELNPQGTLAERIRAAGAGIGGFYTPTGVGTVIEEGKEVKEINGKKMLLEYGLPADFTFVRAHKADTYGNLIYRMTQRNYGPVMAMAGKVTIAEVDEIVEPGDLDPERVDTPGIFVQRVVARNKS